MTLGAGQGHASTLQAAAIGFPCQWCSTTIHSGRSGIAHDFGKYLRLPTITYEVRFRVAGPGRRKLVRRRHVRRRRHFGMDTSGALVDGSSLLGRRQRSSRLWDRLHRSRGKDSMVAVPEPGTWNLLAVAVMGLMALIYSRKRRRAICRIASQPGPTACSLASFT